MMPAPTVRKRRRRRPKGSWISRHRWLGIPLLFAVALAAFLYFRPEPRTQLAGYVEDVGTVRAEYSRFFSKTLADLDVVRQFARAAELVQVRRYNRAIGLLEGVADVTPLPVVYNNLGVLYAAIQDRTGAIRAFREALSRDSSYLPVRHNVARLQTFLATPADLVSHEAEDNDNVRVANPIAVNTPVNGEISGKAGDVDSFKINTPPAPRDILSLELLPSGVLSPAIRIYDQDFRLLEMLDTSGASGEPLRHSIAPDPSSTVYVQVWGVRDSVGPYTLKVQSTHSFDRFEPNDNIFSAAAIAATTVVDAGIMDSRDTDFYSFTAPRTGQLTLDLRNLGTTLLPGLTTFDSERRTTGFAPEAKQPGAGLQHLLPVQAGQTYYLQVWAADDTTGNYTLTIQ